MCILTESKTLEFRGKFFNVFNHAQFNSPTGDISNSAFGVVTSARDPRVGQVAIKTPVLKDWSQRSVDTVNKASWPSSLAATVWSDCCVFNIAP
jgi:hypothetical protein